MSRLKKALDFVFFFLHLRLRIINIPKKGLSVMPKIIKINDASVTIGKEDGSCVEIGKGFLTFVPSVGKKVEVYSNGNDYTVIPVESEVPQSAPAPAAAPAQPQIVINNSNSNQNINMDGYARGKQINKWAAFLICTFFGWAGFHRFYEGKILTGLLWLCTLGLGGVGWFIDWLIILFKPNPYYVIR